MIYWLELVLLGVAMLISYSPLILILIFLVYLFLVVVYLIFILDSYFYSYLVFLLFISGLMIMFMYICSVILNEKFTTNRVFSLFAIPMVSVSYVGHSFDVVLDCFFVTEFYEFYNLAKFYIYSYNLFSIFFVLYLFLCLVVIYEFIKKHKGPLRSMS